mmetsp:Transcript_11332/g.14200  ORF Transcript_11332/g.14200 Transcript_11332/m.14200 type:complete len:149 (-) Transcript_11332:122-568(-)
MKALKVDIEKIVLTAKHHGQHAEAGVQEMAHCAQNRTSEKVSTAMVAGRSLENQWATIMSLNKILETEKLRGNQHMTARKNGIREHISSNSKRKATERGKNDHQKYKSKPQASSRKSKLLIKRAAIKPYPEDRDGDLMLEMVKKDSKT